MATFWANEINATERDITVPTEHIPIMFPLKDKIMQGTVFEDIFSGTYINKQSKKVELCVIEHAALEDNRAYLLHTETTKSDLNNHICQHCGMKTSTVTPSFYCVRQRTLS